MPNLVMHQENDLCEIWERLLLSCRGTRRVFQLLQTPLKKRHFENQDSRESAESEKFKGYG